MRILLTGVNGTVGPKIASAAKAAGHEVVGWQRADVDPNDSNASAAFVASSEPDAIVHLAMGAESWAAQLAEAASRRNIPYVFTSTAMVFDERPDGPYSITSPRTSTNDYGKYKIRCEDAIWAANPNAMIARLGYQIDADGLGNNLVAHADAANHKIGFLRASTTWIPACSFMSDTAEQVLALLASPSAGLHHLDSNAEDAWSYFEIVTTLSRTLSREWSIEATTFPDHDQRLIGTPGIARLSARLQRP